MIRLYAVVSVVSLLAILVSDASAQRGGRGRGNPFGAAGLLMSEQVREEIELLDDQQAELDGLRDEIRDMMRERFAGARDMSREERRALWEEAQVEIREVAQSRVKEVLMPHQMERLEQIELQQQMQRRGGAAVADGRVAEALGLSDEQKEQMQQKAAEAQAELEKKIQELRLEARESVLSVLTPDQRAKFDKLVGKPFEMQFDRRGQRGRRGGGRPGGPGRGESGGEPEIN